MAFPSTVKDWSDAPRLTVVVGHFGSGKTEFSLNLALALAAEGRSVTLADLDVVDPYFRSRERAQILSDHGIRLISSSQACVDADVPSMPAEVLSLFDDRTICGVLDIGGDASGARVLARYKRRLAAENADVLCVVNANRPLSGTAENALRYIREIEQASGLAVTGLVNNTHLCSQTEPEDILAGAELTARVSQMSGIPVVCHVVPQTIGDDLPPLSGPVFPIALFMKKPWE